MECLNLSFAYKTKQNGYSMILTCMGVGQDIKWFGILTMSNWTYVQVDHIPELYVKCVTCSINELKHSLLFMLHFITTFVNKM